LQSALLQAAEVCEGIRRGSAREGARRDALERAEAQGSIRPRSALTVLSAARDSREGRSPEAEACWSGPKIRLREQQQAKRHAGQPRSETPAAPFERGKLRRAESQGRCRHETRPVRVRGEETAERVTKP
jgi:hypothetical protein